MKALLLVYRYQYHSNTNSNAFISILYHYKTWLIQTKGHTYIYAIITIRYISYSYNLQYNLLKLVHERNNRKSMW